VDVHRVAGEIAAGTAVTEPSWRTDTGEGRHARTAFAESRASRRRRSQQTISKPGEGGAELLHDGTY